MRARAHARAGERLVVPGELRHEDPGAPLLRRAPGGGERVLQAARGRLEAGGETERSRVERRDRRRDRAAAGSSLSTARSIRRSAANPGSTQSSASASTTPPPMRAARRGIAGPRGAGPRRTRRAPRRAARPRHLPVPVDLRVRDDARDADACAGERRSTRPADGAAGRRGRSRPRRTRAAARAGRASRRAPAAARGPARASRRCCRCAGRSGRSCPRRSRSAAALEVPRGHCQNPSGWTRRTAGADPRRSARRPA